MAQIRVCDLFSATVAKSRSALPKILDFLKFKSENPTQSYGGSDTAFISTGPIGKTGLKLKHAHITQDLSIVYRVYGNPAIIDCYGVFSHKDLGTGNAANIKAQKSMSTKFSNQEFTNHQDVQ